MLRTTMHLAQSRKLSLTNTFLSDYVDYISVDVAKYKEHKGETKIAKFRAVVQDERKEEKHFTHNLCFERDNSTSKVARNYVVLSLVTLFPVLIVNIIENC